MKTDKTEESLKEKNESLNQENGFSVQAGNCITISEKEPICETHVRNEFCVEAQKEN